MPSNPEIELINKSSLLKLTYIYQDIRKALKSLGSGKVMCSDSHGETISLVAELLLAVFKHAFEPPKLLNSFCESAVALLGNPNKLFLL